MFKDYFDSLLKKNQKELTTRELALMVRHNLLLNSGSTAEEAMEKLESEFNTAKSLSTNSVSNTSGDAGAAKEFVPENVLVSTLIDLGDSNESYAFLSSLVGRHTLTAKKITVPVVGRPRKGRVIPEQASSASFREAKEGIQTAHSGSVEIEAKKLYNNTQLTDELMRYSVVELEALFTGKLKGGMLLDMANIILNADSSNTTGNVNNKGTAPSTTYGATYNQLSEYAFDGGIRKLCLAGAEGVTKLNIGTISGADDIIDLQAMVTSTTNPKQKIILMDGQTYFKQLKNADFKDAAKNGKSSTIFSGAVTNIAGSDIFVTDLLLLADTDGKVSATAANNVTGTMICLDITCSQHGDYDVLRYNTESDFAVSTLLEAVGYRGNTNMVTKDGKVFAAVGYNCV